MKDKGREYSKWMQMALLGVVVVLCVSVSHAADPVGPVTSGIWLGAEGTPLPFVSAEQILEFLSAANVVEANRIGVGINNPYKVLLEKDGIRAHACFRDVKVFKQKLKLEGKVYLNFRDDAIFEVAAYRISRLLGLNNVPPVVERELFGKRGTLQLWLEESFSEKKRLSGKVIPSSPRKWGHEYQAMLLFDALIANFDRNQGNILYDSNWNRWLIDHTRSFLTTRDVRDISDVRQCNRELWNGLRRLDESTLEDEVGDVLSDWQIEGILARRDQIVEHFQDRIDRYGESVVILNSPQETLRAALSEDAMEVPGR